MPGAEAGRGRPATAADQVVAVLVANGVDTVFALPGEENLPLVSALRRAGIELVICRHEQHAGFMAVAAARLTGEPAVCLATLGPGALNLFTPLAQAQLLAAPLLALTGQKPVVDNDEGSFQVVDVVAAASPLVRFATSVSDPGVAAHVVADALSRAVGPPAGPVLVELPEDVAAAPAADGARLVTPRANDRPPAVAAPATVARLADLIAGAERPLVLAGAGAARPDTARALTRLADGTGLSVLATQMGKGALAETHPRSLRSLGIHRPDHAHLALDRADLVVAVGYQPVEHPPLAWQQDRDLPVAHVAVAPAHQQAGYRPELEVVGDPALTLDHLTDRGLAVATAWSDDARQEIEALLAAERGPGDGDAPDPLAVVRLLAGLHRPGDVVALDNGVYKIWFARHFPSPDPQALLLDNGTASMGAGLAAATAAARLGHRATAVVGDGGLLMNVGDLETAVRLALDLTVVVLRDDAYGFIAWHQDEQDRARHGVDLGNPDLVTLARAFGATGTRVATIDDLGRALEARRAGQGVTVIDCPIDYRINDQL